MLDKTLILKLELKNNSTTTKEINDFANYFCTIIGKEKEQIIIAQENTTTYSVKIKRKQKSVFFINVKRVIKKIYEDITDVENLLKSEAAFDLREFLEKNNNFYITKTVCSAIMKNIESIKYHCYKDEEDKFQIDQIQMENIEMTKFNLNKMNLVEPSDKIFAIEDITEELVKTYTLFLNLQTHEKEIFRQLLKVFMSIPIMTEKDLITHLKQINNSIITKKSIREQISN